MKNRIMSLLALLLVACMVFALAACTKNNPEENTTPAGENPTADPAPVNPIDPPLFSEPIEINSYKDIIPVLLGDVLAVKSSTMSFAMTIDGATFSFDITIQEKDGEYLAKIVADNGVAGEGGTIYYNGAAIYMVGNNGTIEAIDLEGALRVNFGGVDFATMMNGLKEQYKTQVDPMLKQYFDLAKTELGAFVAPEGVELSKEELLKSVNDLESMTAKIVKSLGFETTLTETEGAVVITRGDLMNFLGNFFTVTEGEAGAKTLAFSLASLITQAETTLANLETLATKTVGELFMSAFGNDLKELDATIVDFDTFLAYIKATYPGTTKLKIFIDQVLAIVESTNMITKAELFALIDAEMQKEIEGFSTEQVLALYGEKTLDELAFELELDSYDAVLGMISEYAKTVVGTIEIPVGEQSTSGYYDEANDVYIPGTSTPIYQSINELLTAAKAVLAAYKPTLDFSMTVDASGIMTAMSVTFYVKNAEGDFLNPESIPQISISFNAKADATVVIPDNVLAVTPVVPEPPQAQPGDDPIEYNTAAGKA